MTDNKRNSIIDTIKSVAAAFIGVQSDKNRQQDFKHGKLSYFIIVGIAGIVVFISILIVVVSLVIPNS
jgi:hypothetical protein